MVNRSMLNSDKLNIQIIKLIIELLTYIYEIFNIFVFKKTLFFI